MTIDRTLEIKEMYDSEFKPKLVVNCGGYSNDGFLTSSDKKRKYELISSSINHLDRSEIIFCAQSMPPFPWHLGGQQFHNLFIYPNEIHKFCDENNIFCCLDTSHTLMSANYFNFNFLEEIEKIVYKDCEKPE